MYLTVLNFLKTEWKQIAKLSALPISMFVIIKHFEDFEEILIQYLLSETRKIVKRELKQPFLIDTGYRSLKNVIINSIFESPNTFDQTVLLISRLMKHSESEKFGVFVANNLLNKKLFKQMALDLISSYQRYYNFDLIIPENFK